MSSEKKEVNDDNDLDSDILELKIEVEEFIKETKKINNDFIETVNNINLEFRSVDSIFSKHHRQKKVYVELKNQFNELLNENKNELNNNLLKIKTSLSEIKLIVDNLGKSKRKTGSYFVSLIMGKVSVRIWNNGDRYKFKSEYNRFKERWMLIFFIFPALQIIFGFNLFIHQIESILFFFYYSSLAIRENILSLNGSNIESWWIYHHYWSMLISILSLIIGGDDNNQYYGIQYLNYFFFYLGIVILLQNDYQKKRHYARKALNKKSQLDIRTSEVLDETPHSKYKILIPMLYFTYFLQLLISIYFLYLSSKSIDENTINLKSIQIIIMSISWFILSIENTRTLSKVLKKKKLKQMKKSL